MVYSVTVSHGVRHNQPCCIKFVKWFYPTFVEHLLSRSRAGSSAGGQPFAAAERRSTAGAPVTNRGCVPPVIELALRDQASGGGPTPETEIDGDYRRIEGRKVIGPSGAVRVLVAARPVDFRKGAVSLAALLRDVKGADLFVVSQWMSCKSAFLTRSLGT